MGNGACLRELHLQERSLAASPPDTFMLSRHNNSRLAISRRDLRFFDSVQSVRNCTKTFELKYSASFLQTLKKDLEQDDAASHFSLDASLNTYVWYNCIEKLPIKQFDVHNFFELQGKLESRGYDWGVTNLDHSTICILHQGRKHSCPGSGKPFQQFRYFLSLPLSIVS